MSDEEQAQPMTKERSMLLDDWRMVNAKLYREHRRVPVNWTSIHFLEAKKADLEARLLKLNMEMSDE